MKRTLLAFALLAAGSAFSQVSLGIRIGAPTPIRVERFHPGAPGPITVVTSPAAPEA